MRVAGCARARGRHAVVACLAGGLSLSAVAGAQEQPAGEGTEQVIVTGRLEEDLPVDLQKQGTHEEIVTAEQIRNGGFVDVAQALQTLVPGLYISPKNGPFDYADVSLFGSRTQDVLWLVDGVRINNRLYGGTTPLDTLPASMVERIVVLEGTQALFYGTQSPAGAINVLTKAYSDKPDGGLSAGLDTQHGKHVDGYFRDTLAGQQFVLFASDDQSSGFQPFRDQDYQPSSTDRHRSYNMRTFGLKYAVDPVDALRLSASYQHTEGKVDDAYPDFVHTAFNERDEDIVTGKLDYTPGEVAQLFVKGYLHQWRSHYTEFDNDLEDPGTLDVIDNHDFWGFKDAGANAAVKLALNKGFEYYLGADYQAYSGRDAVLVINQHSEHVQAAFAQVATTADLLADATLAAGVRYNDASFGPSATVWDASARVDLPGNLFVKALAGTAFRLPTAEELFADDPEDERGDPGLHPERSRNFNASLGGASADHRFNWELIGFYRDITDLISFDGFDPVTDQSLAENVPGTVRVRGGSLEINVVPTDALTAQVSYTYSHSRQEGDQQIAKVPLQNAKLNLDWHPADLPVGASAGLNYVGQTWQSLWDGFERYGNYVIVDLAARVYLGQARHQFITVRLENAFDKQYAASLGTGTRDADGSNYTYWNLGVPRTLEVRYNLQL